MKGDLKDFNLNDLVQICCQHPDDVRLALTRGENVGAVYFSGGAIVHAESARGMGKAALFDVLSWETGTFVLEKDVKAPLRTVDQPWTSLLLEGAEFLELSRQQRDGPAVTRNPGAEGSQDPAVSAPDEIVRRIQGLAGVRAALLSGAGGEVLSHAGDGDPEYLAAVAAFVGASAHEMAEPLDFGPLKRAVAQRGPDRVVIAGFGSGFVGLWLDFDATVDQVCHEVGSLLGRT